MEYTTLGRTGLTVSRAGLGCGGNSRLGLDAGLSHAESVALVREALDLGVNFLDTAEAYGTESIVGKAIESVPRDSVVISTKSRIRGGGARFSPQEVVANLHASLERLGTDHVDVFNLHGVAPADYAYALETLAPALLAERDRGRIRHLGITETAVQDPAHAMLEVAVRDGVWEVVMLAFHMLNQNARRVLFPEIRRRGVGTLIMFVVRNIFSRPGLLARTVTDLVAAGHLPTDLAERKDPLDFLVHEGGAQSVVDAAYRFVRHEPGVDVVLFGTGSRAHLRANVRSILAPPLPAEDVERLDALFGRLEGVGLDLPERMRTG